jgi:hypothetical protein
MLVATKYTSNKLWEDALKKNGLLLFLRQSHYAAQAGLEITVLLPLPSKCWDYMRVPENNKCFFTSLFSVAPESPVLPISIM